MNSILIKVNAESREYKRDSITNVWTVSNTQDRINRLTTPAVTLPDQSNIEDPVEQLSCPNFSCHFSLLIHG